MLNRLIKNPIIRDTLIVALTWWVILTFIEFHQSGIDFISVAFAMTALRMSAFGVVLGAIWAMAMIYIFKKGQVEALNGQIVRGAFSSLQGVRGATINSIVPTLIPPPAPANVLPERLPHPPGVSPRFIHDWIEHWRTTHPAHADLMTSLLCIYAHQKDLPATHMEGGHGGRTLFEHSLLVSALCVEEATTWVYEGLKGKSGKLLVPLRNPGYKFEPRDPMVGIIGMAHDLGKIDSYIRDSSGKIIGSRLDHDQAGARMLSRMEETWAIPDDDRQVLLSAVAFYHRPMDMPVGDGGVPFDDRTIALMELLIKADTLASRLENGLSREESEAVDTPIAVDARAKLWEGFLDLITQGGRINGANAKYRIGQKNCDETGRALVYLHEASMREALARHLNLDGNAKMGDGTFILTRTLLKVLDEKGVLYKSHQGAIYSDTRAIFMVEFVNRKQEHLANWPAAIVLDPGTVIPMLTNLPDFSSTPIIQRARFGSHSARDKDTPSILEAAAAGGSDALFELAPSRKAAKGGKKPTAEPSPAPQEANAPEVPESPEIEAAEMPELPEPPAVPGEDPEETPEGPPQEDDMPEIGPPVDADETPEIGPPVDEDSTAEALVAQPHAPPPEASLDAAPAARTADAQPVAATTVIDQPAVPRDVPTMARLRAESVVADLLSKTRNGLLKSASLPDGRIIMTWDKIQETDPKLNWNGFRSIVMAGAIEGISFATAGEVEVLVVKR